MLTNTIKDFTIKYTDVEENRMSSTEFQENDRSKGQKIAYMQYNHPKFGSDQPLVIQAPWIRMENYGVPRMDERYFKNDADRAFVKIPLNDTIPESAELIKMFIKFDELFSSKEFCSKMLKKHEKYTYQPIFRKPVINEDDDDDSKKKSSKQSTIPKYPYIKLKIDTDYTSGEIKTKLYRSEIINNKRVRNEIQDITSIDDFARIVCWNCNFRPIIRFVKFWAQPLTKKDPTWGVTFKIIKAEVEAPTKGNSLYKDYMNSDAFLDSDEETNNAPSIPIKKVKQIESNESDEKPKSPKKVTQVESDDDESEEEKPKVVKKVAQVESDDDESEEEKPKVVKKVAQVESDDDESEEEKPKVVKKVAQVESDDSDESDEKKPPPPIKKPAPKTTGRNNKAKN